MYSSKLICNPRKIIILINKFISNKTDKKGIIMKLIKNLFLLLVLVAFSQNILNASLEVRGIWINSDAVPKTNKETINMVKEYHRAGINLLFPEMVCRGYAVFPSDVLERDPRFVKADDILPTMIKEAHKYGMEVHPWVWAFRAGYTNNPGAIITKHPEWLESSKYGETLSINGGMWISPVIPEAREFLLNVYKELATKYNIDGFHLDYIRYEIQNPLSYGYNKYSRDKFKSLYGMDPLEIEFMTNDYLDWLDFRSMYIDTFVQEVYRTMKSINSNILVSAAVANNPNESRQNYCQNWGHWADNGWVDMLIPMTYTSSNDRFKELMSLQLDRMKGKVVTTVGIGSLNFTKDERKNESQIEMARDVNYMGQALFASAYYTKTLGDLLANGVYKDKAKFPFRSKDFPAYNTVLNYQKSLTKYVPNLTPAMDIPDSVSPIPSYDIERAKSFITIDGDVTDEEWESYKSVLINQDNIGNQTLFTTEVKAVWDEDGLIISYICKEPEMNKIKAEATTRDGWTFYDDSVEIFINMVPNAVKYNHFSVNTLNTHFDQQIYNMAWNKNWESGVKKYDTYWTCEIKIPFAELSVPTPKINEKWRLNFTRNRWVTGKVEYLNWSVPYGSFHCLERFGNVTYIE